MSPPIAAPLPGASVSFAVIASPASEVADRYFARHPEDLERYERERTHLAAVKALLKRFFSDAPWTPADDAALADLVGAGRKSREIARHVERLIGAIKNL